MKNLFSKKILATILTITMMLSLVLVFTVSGSAEADGVYTLNVSDLANFGIGGRENGEYEKCGTHNYFTAHYSAKAKLEANDKTFTDGFNGTKRFAWGDKTTIGEEILNAVQFTTRGAATVKLWWVGGDANRLPTIFDESGATVVQSKKSTVKNEMYVEELSLSKAGTYYLGNTGGSNYFYQIQVSDSGYSLPAPQRADWSTVATPSITSSTDNGTGNIVVNVSALIGLDGGDELLVHLYNGSELVKTKGSVTAKSSHTITFTPENSGNYTVKAELLRDGENAKAAADSSLKFVFPLATPYLSSVTSKGSGSIEVLWTEVHEAEVYEVYQNGTKVAGTTDCSYVAEGLTIGETYTYYIVAVRGSERTRSEEKSTEATANAQRTWGFTTYGDSTNTKNNGYVGSVNEDGQVTVFSEGGKGKIQPASVDGLAFYYTAIPSNLNFTIRAKVSVDSWTLSNGQEGFGLLVTDRLGPNGDPTSFWNNQYFAGATKIEYRVNPDSEPPEIINVSSTQLGLTKYTMKLGIGTIAKTGVTNDNLSSLQAQDTDVINREFKSVLTTLETTASQISGLGGTFNIIGNYTTEPAGNLDDRFLVTEMILEIQKNNTGYFVSYYDLEGNLISRVKNYYPDALSQLDPDFVYAGFCASRNARATFSDISVTTIDSKDDVPAEEAPYTIIDPQLVINSGSTANDPNYKLIIDPNVSGTVNIKYNDRYIKKNLQVAANERQEIKVTLTKYDLNENVLYFEFTPDPDQELPEFHKLASTGTKYSSFTIKLTTGNYHKKNIYVSPSVLPYTTVADGTKENPYDIYTAINNAYPGQTIILMEGTYKMSEALTIQRGMNGTAENPIRMIADPEATTRPVLDFQKLYAGFTHAGDYWYFYGFDVTNSLDMQKGFQVSGSHNVLDQIHAYENGNTGIQICRLKSTDLNEYWPSYNLILNCTSYRNYDGGFEDADGFAAKLTVGEGNVFDGCIAYHNADDGWDLYAKVETGSIGSVTIRNCVAYENGFVPGAGSKTGNGNGFKLGGTSLSGKHVIENSIAFGNLLKGIDSNSCPDIIVKNCVSFNNGGANYAFYTNNVKDTAFVSNGAISFRTENLGVAENLKGTGKQVVSDYINASTYYWNAEGGYAANADGVKITADMFVSLEFNGWERNADGTINLKGFLEIKSNVPANASEAKLGGTASEPIVLAADEACSFSDAWTTIDNNYHWHSCECGNKKDIEKHDFVWIIDKEQVGMLTGEKHEECTICHYKRATITTYPDPSQFPGTGDDDHECESICEICGKCLDSNCAEEACAEKCQGHDDLAEPAPKLNFFQRIWQAILNFFRNLFGIKPKD